MQVERLRRDGTFRVELHATPVSGPAACADVPVAEGRTLAALLERADWRRSAERTRVFLGGWEVPRERWRWLRPRAGARVVVVGMPAEPATLTAIGAFLAGLADAAIATVTLGGFGGLAPGLATTATLGAAGAAGATVGTLIGGAAIVAGVSALGSSLLDPPSQDIGRSPGQASPTLQGAPNTARRNEPYPYVLGDIRGVPPFGAFPASIVSGTESEAMYLFVLGPGPLAIDAADIRMGEVPVSSFAGVELAIREGTATDPPLQIYTNRIFQVALNNVTQPLTYGHPDGFGAWVQTQIPGTGHRKLGVDFNFTTGLGRYSNSGRVQIYHVGMQVQYRTNGGAWFEATTLSSFSKLGTHRQGQPRAVKVRGNSVDVVHFRGSDFSPFQIGFEWAVGGSPGDVFDVRIRRCETVSADLLPQGPGSRAVSGTIVWYAAKGLNYESSPILDDGISTIEIRTPVNEQFRGLPGLFSARARRKARIYDPAAVGGADADGWSVDSFETRNPAALIRDVLQGPGNIRPRTDAQIDVEALTDFYVWCRDFDDGGSGPLAFDLFVDFGNTSQEDLCRTIAAAGLGRFGRDSRGRYTVIFDGPKTVPVAMVNAANSRGFSMEVLFPPELHGIRAQFTDRDHGFEPESERIVYADGYDDLSADPGKLETIRFTGITDPKLIYVHARRRLADRALRRRRMIVEMHVEHLAFGVGDLVLVSHPGALVGAHWGRVKTVSTARYRDTFELDPAPYAPFSRLATDATLEIGVSDLGSTHGTQAARITSQNTSAAIWSQPFETGSPQDWTALRVRIDARPEDAAALAAADGLRIRVYGPTSMDWREWRRGTSHGLSAGAWGTASVELGVDTPDATSGSPSSASVISVEFRTNVVAPEAGRVWGFDNLRVDSAGSEASEVVIDQPVDMAAGESLTLDHRRVDASGPALAIQTLSLRSLSDFGVGTDRVVPAIYLRAPLASGKPSAGDLVTVGVSARMICHSKDPGPDLTARVTFVDEAPGVHSSATVIPAFDPQVMLPVPIDLLGPARPVVRSVVSDERALLRSRSGRLRPSIRIDLEPGQSRARPPADGYAVRYRKVGGSAYVALPTIGLTPSITIDGVDELQTYDVVLQAVDGQGRSSEPVTIQVLVTGNTNAPPNVEEFRLEGQSLRWSLDDLPADLAGFEIRRGDTNSTFATARRIHGPMLVAAPPFDVSGLQSGLSRLHIVAVDATGLQSEIASSIEAFLGELPAQNQVDVYDVAGAGFPAIDQVDRVLEGFEGLQPKETPDGEVEVLYPDEEPGPIDTLLGVGGTVLDLETAAPLTGVRSLRMTGDASDLGATVTYVDAYNREGSGIRVDFFGDKSATWTCRIRIIDALDPDKWARFDTGSIAGLTPVTVSVPDVGGTADATGTNGAPDLRALIAVEVTATNDAYAAGDECVLDELQWFGGSLNGVVIDGTDLVNQERGDPYWPEDDISFWGSDSDPFWADVIYLPGTYEFSVMPSASSIPCELRIEHNADIGVDYTIEYKLGDRFVAFPGLIPVTTTAELRFMILLDGGSVQGRITDLRVIFDVEDEREFVENASIASSGTSRIPISKSYRSIRRVQLALQSAGAKTWSLIDTDPVNGPAIEVYDAAGSRIAATVDAFLEGVKGQ